MSSASRIARSNTVDLPFLPSRKKLHKSFDILVRCFRRLSFFRPNFAFSLVVFASAPFSFHERLRMECDILKKSIAIFAGVLTWTRSGRVGGLFLEIVVIGGSSRSGQLS